MIIMKNLTSVINANVQTELEEYNPTPSKELLEALEEGKQIIKDIKNGKRKPYDSPEELFADLDNE